MDPETANLSKLELFKFNPILILRGEFEKVTNLTLNCLRSPLRIVLPRILFTYYMDQERPNIQPDLTIITTFTASR